MKNLFLMIVCLLAFAATVSAQTTVERNGKTYLRFELEEGGTISQLVYHEVKGKVADPANYYLSEDVLVLSLTTDESLAKDDQTMRRRRKGTPVLISAEVIQTVDTHSKSIVVESALTVATVGVSNPTPNNTELVSDRFSVASNGPENIIVPPIDEKSPDFWHNLPILYIALAVGILVVVIVAICFHHRRSSLVLEPWFSAIETTRKSDAPNEPPPLRTEKSSEDSDMTVLENGVFVPFNSNPWRFNEEADPPPVPSSEKPSRFFS